MRREILISVAAFLGALIVLLTAAIVYLSSLQSNGWKEIFTYWVEKTTPYKLDISGNVTVGLSLHPRITAENISLHSKNDPSEYQSLTISGLDFQVNLVDLVYGLITIEHLYLNNFDVDVESENLMSSENEDDSGDQNDSAAYQVVLHHLTVKNSRFTYTDLRQDLIVLSFDQIRFDSEDDGASANVLFNGDFQHQPFSFSGSIVDPYTINSEKPFGLTGRYLNAELKLKGRTQIANSSAQTSFSVSVNTGSVSQFARQLWRSLPRRPGVPMYDHVDLGRGVLSVTGKADHSRVSLSEINLDIGDAASPNNMKIQGSVRDIKKLDELGDNLVAIRELAIQAGHLEKHNGAIELWQRYLKQRVQ